MDVIKEECRVKLHVLDVQASELSGLPAKRKVFQKHGDVFFLSDRQHIQDTIKEQTSVWKKRLEAK
ncbi:uncharacterized protein [Blastocystis hominis]|uniref:Uncharacterized protein n=1 Tax=Blastocystis hominis TaxID=12968 RepID=D8LUW0_BLAHO|nr:uncharacterized protein [Blastocystis hominis]CBK19599.2 unnamed protein product [Blastocystis hominis]|eukprot:XP_012893647.1 uncharacterized protein [Blastocystis hominis]